MTKMKRIRITLSIMILIYLSVFCQALCTDQRFIRVVFPPARGGGVIKVSLSKGSKNSYITFVCGKWKLPVKLSDQGSCNFSLTSLCKPNSIIILLGSENFMSPNLTAISK